jgi:type VI protein secretion system component Hcp
MQKPLYALAVSCALGFTCQALGAERIFLDAGIDGGALTADFRGQIVLESFDFGLGQPEAGGVGRGRVSRACRFDELTTAKRIDDATADLIEAAALGRVFPEITITLTRPAENGVLPALQLTLREARVSRFETMADDGSMTEMVNWRFREVLGEVFVQNRNGGLRSEPFNVTCF